MDKDDPQAAVRAALKVHYTGTNQRKLVCFTAQDGKCAICLLDKWNKNAVLEEMDKHIVYLIQRVTSESIFNLWLFSLYCE